MIVFTDVTKFFNKLKDKKIKIPKNMSDEQFARWYDHMLKTHGEHLNTIK